MAQLAGVNRGTAYQHFETRDDLIKATVDWVSSYLSDTVFGQPDVEGNQPRAGHNPVYDAISGMAEFAVENPELGRIWLFEILASDNPSEDRFFKQFFHATETLVRSEVTQDGIDAEVLSVMMLATYFLWPVWVRSRAHSNKDRQRMSHRMRREVLRLSLHGLLRAEAVPHLQKLLEE